MTTSIRRRRPLAALAAALVFFLSITGALVLAIAPPALALAPLQLDTPEGTPIVGPNYTFVGTADPGDTVTVDSPISEDCVTVTDPGGNWSCEVTFFASADITIVTASRPDDGTPAQDSEGWEYTVVIPPTIDAHPPTNDATPTITGTAYFPNDAMSVLVGGVACPVDPMVDENWSCTPVAPVPEGNQVISADQTIAGVGSAPAFSSVWVDTTGPGLPEFASPYPSFDPPGDTATTNVTPTFTGSGDPLGTVHVLSVPVAGPPAAINLGAVPATPVCDAPVDEDGFWECTAAAPFAVGSYHNIGAWQEDWVGNTGLSPDAEFRLGILPPPPPPTIDAPTPGMVTTDPAVTVSGTIPGPGSYEVRTEDDAIVCPAEELPAGPFSCVTTPLSVGPHTLTIQYTDNDLTSSFASVSITVAALTPVVPPPAPTPTPTPTPTTPPVVKFKLEWSLQITDEDGNDLTGAELQPGQRVVLTSSGLPPSSTVTAELHSTPMSLGSTIVGPDGSFRLATSIPEDVEPGDHEFVVTVTPPGEEPSPVSVGVPIVAPPEPEPEPDPVVDDTPEGNSAGGGGSGIQEPADGIDQPTIFGSSLSSPFELRVTPLTIAVTGSVAAAFLLLVAFPAELLDSTIRSNYGRVFGWLTPLRRRFERVRRGWVAFFARPWIGSIVTLLAGAVILGFADPSFGFNGASARLLLAMILSLTIVNIGISLLAMAFARRRYDIASVLEPMPAALLLVALSVLVSRLAGLSPGFLFGLVVGVAFARELRKREDGVLALLGIGATILLGVAAWFGYGLLGADGSGFWYELSRETLVAITLESVGTIVITLLPLEFLDGKVVFRWSKLAWLATYIVGLVVFLLVVVPLSDNWGEASAPLLGWGALFALFAVLAIGIWAYFRFVRPRGAHVADGAEEAEPARRE